MGVSLSFLWELVNTVQVFEFMSLLQVNFPTFVISTMRQLTISGVDYLPIRSNIKKTITHSQLRKPWIRNFKVSNYSTSLLSLQLLRFCFLFPFNYVGVPFFLLRQISLLLQERVLEIKSCLI